MYETILFYVAIGLIIASGIGWKFAKPHDFDLNQDVRFWERACEIGTLIGVVLLAISGIAMYLH